MSFPTPAFASPEVLFAACQLGVFDALAGAPEPLGADAVARRLGTSSRGTELLLDACVSLKLLQVHVRRGKGECPLEAGVSSAPAPHPFLQRAGDFVSSVRYRLLTSALAASKAPDTLCPHVGVAGCR